MSGGKGGQRRLRVGEEIRHALARLIAEHKLADPHLAGRSATVTEVRISPDLRSATAFILPFAAVNATAAENEALIAALNRAAGYFRGGIARALKLRVAPTLSFRLDESFAESGRIEQLLRDPAVARDLEADEEGER